MSSPLKQNATVLQELLYKINQLPEAGIIPSGTLSITENGTYDVTEYASVEVDVEGSGTGGGLSFNGKAAGAVGVNGYASAEILVVDKSAFSSSAVAELTA